MNDPRVLVTVAVRLIGLLILGFGIGPIASALANFLPVLIPPMANIATPRAQILGAVLYIVSMLLTPLVGLYLLFGGRWIIAKILRGLDPRRCPSCGYDVASLNTEQCPECNAKLLRKA